MHEVRSMVLKIVLKLTRKKALELTLANNSLFSKSFKWIIESFMAFQVPFLSMMIRKYLPNS